MSRWAWCLGVLSLLGFAQGAAGGDLLGISLGRELRCTRCGTIPCVCPNDYCRKPLPCAPLCIPTCPDDYCRKPLPCLPCLCIPGCPDDYCRKPFPEFCWPANKQYRCPPGSDAAYTGRK